ncbi:hypothetical protein [Pseudarthrobacter sp. ATCC 49987]|uniref:hypothetical protein n=1 Tax=Pseudarthrobacter sp. ATCC 49987 TaxID=2698204 RepID=UPI0019224686|nr:hypothetical protein [Pseudarthrobacter sp. ATCC 49987]
MLTSLLRTIVPYAWGLVVTWLITVLPVLAPLETDLKGLATIALPVLAAVLSGAWYAFWRWLEPRLPDWLTRAVLGSAKAPVYPGKHIAGSQVPNVNPEQRLTANPGERLNQ